MIKAYRNSYLATRLGIVSVIVILGSLLAWVNNTNPLYVAGAVIPAAVLIEFAIMKTRLFWIALVWVVNFILLAGFSVVLYTVFSGFYGESQGMFASGFILLASLITTIIIGTIIWLYGYGPTIINFVTAFTLYDISLATFVGNFAENSLLIPVGLSLVAGLIYPVLNIFIGSKIRNKRKIKNIQHVPSNKLTTLIKEELNGKYSSNGETVSSVKEPLKVPTNGLPILKNGKWLFVIVFAGENVNSLSLEKGFLEKDNLDYSWMLEYVAEQASAFSRMNKIPQKKITPILAVPKISPARSITPVTIKSKLQPQKPIGTVLIIQKSKLSKMLNKVSSDQQL